MFGLINKTKLIDNLCMIIYRLELEVERLKNRYDNKECTEWSYYRDLWNLRGKLQMLEEIVNKLGE